MIIFWYAILTTAFWVGTSIYMQINRRKIRFLADIRDDASFPEPPVAIIIAVRNEEADLRQALQSVCQLNYRNYRIVVINDRSTDRTPEILQEYSRQYSKISVLEIKTLPPGWLGKNNALYQGYLNVSEEWLLFTDADVVYEPNALRKAMQYAVQNQLDFLTILPEIRSRSATLVSVIATFRIMLEFKLQPWNARNPKSKASIGVGAFNLLKRSAYEKAGTHQPIALRPDDDLKLAEQVKKAGLKLDVLYGDLQIGLEWYTCIREFINGLMKNTFATSNYNIFLAIGTALSVLLAFVLPFPVLLIFGSGPERWLALILFIFLIPLFITRNNLSGKWQDALWLPFAGLLMMYIIMKSTWLTLRQGGIYWRNSFYPLSELKKNR